MVDAFSCNVHLNSNCFDEKLNIPLSTPNLTNEDSKRHHNSQRCLEAFIRGDYMCKQDEKLALTVLKSISATDLYKTVETSLNSIYNFKYKCNCETCSKYNSSDLNCDLRRYKTDDKSIAKLDKVKEIQSMLNTENIKYLEYVDSLKVSIGSLNIAEVGWQKIETVNKNKPTHLINYFLEYTLPDCILPRAKRSVVDSQRSPNNIKLCARKFNSGISFKHSVLHNLKSLSELDIDKCQIHFKISFRGSGQKEFHLLGYATFNFGEILLHKNVSCSKSLNIQINKNVPIIVGSLRVLFQLGCGKLYFGETFVDAINSSQNNIVSQDSDDDDNSESVKLKSGPSNLKKTWRRNKVNKTVNILNSKTFDIDPSQRFTDSSPDLQTVNTGIHQTCLSLGEVKKSTYLKENRNDVKEVLTNVLNSEKHLLYGFLYISEAEYSSISVTSTFIKVQSFCHNETLSSRVIKNTENPIFDFHHIVPLIYEDELLLHLRENFLVIEFWHKTLSTCKAFGLTKVPLHQLYLAYRNSFIFKYLKKNKLPVIGTDWWEPICCIDTDDNIGRIKILVALGTEDQINNLKIDRGFTFVTANDSSKKQISVSTVNESKQRNNKITDKKPTSISPEKIVVTSEKNTQTGCAAKIEVATQFNDNREIQLPVVIQKMEDKQQTNSNITKELLGTFLNQLMSQRQNPLLETGTNAETKPTASTNCNLQKAQTETNVQLKKTSDLLHSLEKALSEDNNHNSGNHLNPLNQNSKKESFQVTVEIISANNLPSRTRCKSRKTKHLSNKNGDNILPNCYVSFENVSGETLKVTPISFRITNPTWNFKCNVNLPLELLQNSQKKLVFKVWRKSNSTLKTPNMQVDTLIGFAALDLTVLLAGLPNIQGWFNITDFSGRCNGQINIHITPLEELTKYKAQRGNHVHSLAALKPEHSQVSEIEPSETLSRALKRKFTELDEITQRLRLRLSEVVEDDSDASSDITADQFDKDINTLSIEEDFDLINFENNGDCEEPRTNLEDENVSNSKLLMTDNLEINDNVNGSSKTSSIQAVSEDSICLNTGSNSSSSLEQNLRTGKQQISSLLEKLTLLSAEANKNGPEGYSMNEGVNNSLLIDTEAILKELQSTSRPNIQSPLAMTTKEMQDIYDSLEDSKTDNNDATASSSSDTSLITNFSGCRLAPDGQGNTSDESMLQNDKSP